MLQKLEKRPKARQSSEAVFPDDSITSINLGRFDTNIELSGNQENCCYGVYSEHAEINNRFTPKRKNSILLSDSLYRLGFESRSIRMSDCGTLIDFSHDRFPDGSIDDKGTLIHANFCRDRLCPMCSWRRSLKIFSQISSIMSVIQSDYKFVFLTLTVPSVSGDDLKNRLDDLFIQWHKFIGYRRFSNIILGYFRALEITRNDKTGLYHPHFHVVLAVPKSYGYDRSLYITRNEFLELWQKACKDNSITQVDVRLVRSKDSSSQDLGSAVAEIAKYAVKDSDYIFPKNQHKTDSIVFDLNSALRGRRLVSYGGIFKDVFNQLKMDDADSENADLIHIGDSISSDLVHMIVSYGWSVGAYKITQIRFEEVHNG